jgi:NAD(P)-dependent dehydrogenase (short-subunit alcohol dehydrogenase family)
MTEAIAVVVGQGELGREVAAQLAGSGHSVVAVDRNQENLKDLPAGVRVEPADATDPAAAAAVIDRIAGEVGPPRILVNTVGAFWPGDALSTTPDQLRTMLDVNLGAAFWLSQAVSPHMIEQGSGAILHVSARPGLEPTEGMAAYAASKAALAHLVRLLDVELRPKGIRVNGVAPLVMSTERNKEILPKELLAQAVTPKAIATIVTFLVSDAAAPVSGAVLPAYG